MFKDLFLSAMIIFCIFFWCNVYFNQLSIKSDFLVVLNEKLHNFNEKQHILLVYKDAMAWFKNHCKSLLPSVVNTSLFVQFLGLVSRNICYFNLH